MFTADAFVRWCKANEFEEERRRAEGRKAALELHGQRIRELAERRLTDTDWRAKLHGAQRSAAQGLKEFMPHPLSFTALFRQRPRDQRAQFKLAEHSERRARRRFPSLATRIAAARIPPCGADRGFSGRRSRGRGAVSALERLSRRQELLGKRLFALLGELLKILRRGIEFPIPRPCGILSRFAKGLRGTTYFSALAARGRRRRWPQGDFSDGFLSQR